MTWRRDEDGAAAVEFALISVVLIPLLFGMVVFGFALFAQQSAQHAAREGARLASVGVNDSCGDFQAIVADRGNGADVVASEVELAYDDVNGGGLGAGDDVTVTVPYTVDLGLLGFMGFETFEGSRTGTARVEQVGTVTSCP